MLSRHPLYAVCLAMHSEDFGTREPAAADKHSDVWSFTQKQFVTDDEDYVFV